MGTGRKRFPASEGRLGVKDIQDSVSNYSTKHFLPLPNFRYFTQDKFEASWMTGGKKRPDYVFSPVLFRNSVAGLCVAWQHNSFAGKR